MYIDSSEILNSAVYQTVKDVVHCTICTGIIIEPQQCLTCDNCFCKGCIANWQSKSKSCPMKCPNPSFKDSRIVRNVLSKLVLKCPKSCPQELPYDEYFSHENECMNTISECPTCNSKVKRCEIQGDSVKVINALKEEINTLKSKLSYYESNTVPTMFNNSQKTFKTVGGNFLRTISSEIPLPDVFTVKLRMKKLDHAGHMVIGVSDKVIIDNKGYLGGDLGNGNWGLAGNGALGEEGKWTRGGDYKQGDILTLKGKGSEITYMVNDKSFDYKYNLKNKPLYLTISYYYENQVLELIA
jgi:hypothetical protein